MTDTVERVIIITDAFDFCALPALGEEMKKYLLVASIFLIVSGCESMIIKNFKVITDPPDAVIRVVSGIEQKEQRYTSPASITVEVSQAKAHAPKAVVEVSKNRYKPVTIEIRQINDGDTIRIKLEEIIYYRMKYRLLRPVQSDEIKLRDRAISISFSVNDKSFQMSLTNHSNYPLMIHWGQAEYMDIFERTHRLMPSGVHFEERNNPIPDQVILPGKSVLESLTPISNVYVSPQTKNYEVKPLFAHEAGVELKGKTFNLFIPIEIDRAITPYNFKIEIFDVTKDNVKQ